MLSFLFFFFNDTATTEIYTLSLHDALPICPDLADLFTRNLGVVTRAFRNAKKPREIFKAIISRKGEVGRVLRSEEHTSELQSPCNLVCRLLLEKKKKKRDPTRRPIPAPDSR